MSQEPPELTALKRTLGHQLAALREAAEIVQQQVARRTGYSRSSVAKAEAGRQLLTRDFWQTADELFQADGVLLAGYERVLAAKQEHERQSREAELAEAYAAAQALRAPTATSSTQGAGAPVAPSGQEVLAGLADLVAAVDAERAGGLAGSLLYERLVTFLRERAETMDPIDRRELLRLLRRAAAAVAVSPVGNLDTEEQERLTQALASPGRVDAQVIDSIEAILQHCKRQDDALGPRAALHTVLGQRQLVRSLLKGCPSALRPRLLSVYSSMSSSVGTYFFDLDDIVSAMHYCDQAREAAQEARNTELASYALCNTSYIASWYGKVHTAIDSAAAAQSLAGKTDDVLLQACAAEKSASAYAADGQHKECMTEFDQALVGILLPAGRRPPESPAYYFHEGLIISKQSDCLLQLGKPAAAAVTASRALNLFDNSFTHGLAYCTLRLGTARLLSGDVDEGVRVIGEGASLAARIRSTRLTSEVRAARGRMQPWADTAAVTALDERLAGLRLDA